MSNITVHFHNNATKAQGWVSQCEDKQAFGMIIMIPKGHHQFPMGAVLIDYQTSDIHYMVEPNGKGEPECECHADPYVPNWWYMPHTKLSKDPPSPSVPLGLQCWVVGEHVDMEVCVRKDNPTIPVQEYILRMRPDIFYFEFDHSYKPDSCNSTLLTIPKLCMNKVC